MRAIFPEDEERDGGMIICYFFMHDGRSVWIFDYTFNNTVEREGEVSEVSTEAFPSSIP